MSMHELQELRSVHYGALETRQLLREVALMVRPALHVHPSWHSSASSSASSSGSPHKQEDACLSL
jgi:hypothetical protein